MSAQRLFKRVRVLAAVLAAVLVATACGASKGDTSSTDASGVTTVTIAYGAPIADHMVPSVADSAGLFQKYGIKAQIKFLESSQLLTSLVSGQVQFVVVPAPGPEILALNGTPIQEIAQWEDSFDTLFVSNQPTLAALNGKSASIAKPGDFAWLLAEMAQRRANIKLNSVPIGNISNQIAAFTSGQVDAVTALSPSQLPDVTSKVPAAHTLIDWRTERNVPGIQVVGYGPWLQAHRDVVVNVLRAINAGVAYYKDPANESQTVNVISKVTGGSPQTSQAAYQDALKAMSSSIVPTLESQKNVLSYLTDAYPEANGFDASKLIDTSYATAATK